jgi:hypothetical protein
MYYNWYKRGVVMGKRNYGSIWRKTDLHVHTPFSYLNNEFGNNFEEYFVKLLLLAIEKNIEVIGITDYFTIEGYKKIKEIIDGNKLQEILSQYYKIEQNGEKFTDKVLETLSALKNIVFLPNIEFRLNKLVGKNRINFHIIFSDDVALEDIQENFLDQINFVLEGNQLGDEKRSLTKRNLEMLGQKLKNEHENFSGKTAISVGMMNAVVDDSQIIEVLNNKRSIFKNKYLIVTPADEDLSKISWDSQDHNVRKTILAKSHIFFTSNEGTIKWGLGKFHKNKNEYIKEFTSLKPCVHGSDAHKFEKLFEPDYKKYCWIKADLSFEGLKQIIFEPETRVKIQEEKPDFKQSYIIIDAVRFIGHSDFSNDWIYLNQNLNSIIGGKSSGKSLLLYYIAKTIIPDRIDSIKKELGNIQKYLAYNLEEQDEFDFEVKWKDGEIYKLNKKEGKNRLCTYIPQMYLNHIAENEKSKKELNRVIEDILKSDDEFKNMYNEKIDEIGKLKKEVELKIDNLFKEEEKHIALNEELKSIGDEEAIKKSVEEYKKVIDNLEKNSELSDEEINKYKKYSTFKKKLLDKIEESKENLSGFNEIIKVSTPLFEKEINDFISEKYKSGIKKNFEKVKVKEEIDRIEKMFKNEMKNFLSEIKKVNQNSIDLIETQIKKRDCILEELDKKLKPLSEKMLNIELIRNKSKEMEKENLKLKTISEKKKSIEKKIDEKNKLQESILENYNCMLKNYNELVSEIKKNKNIGKEKNIELIPEIKFNNEEFEANFADKINKSINLESQFGKMFDKNNFKFINEKHSTELERIFNTILDINSNIQYNKGFSREKVLKALLDNYFYIDYDLMQSGDGLLDMSPGKRGIILFQLFLHLSSSDTPILVDQPEDNLDNRTVYQELNQFIKDKKSKRQIIIVSHNANLVVSTDSENVIVANQAGQNGSNDNKEFKFEYINGALEDTKETPNEKGILYQKGIREHVCEILEGGEEAFKVREKKYNIE